MEWIFPGIAVTVAVAVGFWLGDEHACRRLKRRITLANIREKALVAIGVKLAVKMDAQDQREKLLERYEAKLNEWARDLEQRQRSSITLDEHATTGPATWVIPPDWTSTYTGPISDPGMPVSPLTHHRAAGRVPGKVAANAAVPIIPDLPKSGRHTEPAVAARNAHADSEKVRERVADDPTGTVLLEPISVPRGAQ